MNSVCEFNSIMSSGFCTMCFKETVIDYDAICVRQTIRKLIINSSKIHWVYFLLSRLLMKFSHHSCRHNLSSETKIFHVSPE